MELIQQFLGNTSSTGRFTIEVDGGNPFGSKCSIRFVFVEIGSPSTRYMFFLPDYEPSLMPGDANNPYTLKFVPINNNTKPFVLKTEDESLLKIWYHYAKHSQDLLDEMLKMAMGTSVLYEEVLFVSFSATKSSNIYKVRLENTSILFIEDSGKAIIEKQITSRTRFLITYSNNSIGFKIHDSNSDDYITFDTCSFDSIKIWYLSLSITRSTVEANERLTISAICEDIEPEPEPEKVIIEQKENTNELEKATQSLELKLNDQLKKYKKQFSQMDPIPEPTLEIIDKSKYSHNIELPKLPERKPVKKMTQDQLSALVKTRLSNPVACFTKYSPLFFNTSLEIPKYAYDNNSQETFKNNYINSNQTDCFLMLCSLVLNGFIGESLSGFYGVDKIPNEDRIREASRIVQTLQTSVLNMILSSHELSSFYSPDSIAMDTELIKSLLNANKLIDHPGDLPKELRYMFPHKPMELLNRWFYDASYANSIQKLVPQKVFFEFIYCIEAVFAHFLVGCDVYTFAHSVANSMGPLNIVGNWSIIRTASDRNAWIQFWHASLKDRKLSSNFVSMISNSELIMSHYLRCSLIRSFNDVQIIVGFLSALETFSVQWNFEINYENNEKSLTKNFIDFVFSKTKTKK